MLLDEIERTSQTSSTVSPSKSRSTKTARCLGVLRQTHALFADAFGYYTISKFDGQMKIASNL